MKYKNSVWASNDILYGVFLIVGDLSLTEMIEESKCEISIWWYVTLTVFLSDIVFIVISFECFFLSVFSNSKLWKKNNYIYCQFTMWLQLISHQKFIISFDTDQLKQLWIITVLLSFIHKVPISCAICLNATNKCMTNSKVKFIWFYLL